jgi:hypothetical protein
LCLAIFPAANPFGCHTYRIAFRKFFPCHTSEKQGGWGLGSNIVNPNFPTHLTTATMQRTICAQ